MTGIFLGLALLLGAAVGWVGVIVSAAVTGIGLVGYRRRFAWSVGLVPLALLGYLRVYAQEGFVVPDLPPGESHFEGEVDSRPIENGRTQRFEFVIDGLTNAEGREFRLCATAPLVPEVELYDRIRIQGVVTWIDAIDDRSAGYVKSRGCSGTIDGESTVVTTEGHGAVAWLDRTRRDLTRALHRAVPGDGGALLAGLVTGDDTALPYDRRDDFIVTGTSHITAVSGSNLAVIVTILTFAGGVGGFAQRWPWQLATAMILWLYVGIIGPSPPPLRAACVATLAIAAFRLGRKPDFITLSVVVAVIELLLRPADFESLAFRLSTVSAIALVLGLSGREPRGWRGWIGHSIFGTAATQAATAVFLIPVFGRFAIYAIPANLVIASLCTVAFPLALVAGVVGLISPMLAAAIAGPAAIPAALVLASAEYFAGLPGANLGSSLGDEIHSWVWALIGITAVVLLSKECKGGLVRLGGGIAAADVRTRAVVAGSVTGTVLGGVAGWLAR